MISRKDVFEHLMWVRQGDLPHDGWVDFAMVNLEERDSEVGKADGFAPFREYRAELRIGQLITVDKQIDEIKEPVLRRMTAGIHHCLYGEITAALVKLANDVVRNAKDRDDAYRTIMELISRIEADS